MIKYYYLLLIIFSIFVNVSGQPPTLNSSSQSNQPEDINLSLANYIQENPLEKVHVHFDKSIYAIGDTVWYKVYLVNNYNNQLSALSKLVHIEILNTEGHLQKILLPVNAGMANGHLVLSAQKFKEGMYQFYVYTQLMSSEKKKFYAFNLNVGVKGIGDAPIASSEISSLKFYPEGGTLVAALRSKVVVKSQDAYGNPVPASGYIIDEENNKVAEFSTGKSGMYLFALSPKQDGKYSAILDKTPTNKRFDLPKVINSGYVLAVNSMAEDMLMVRISKSRGSEEEVRLVFQANGSVINVMPVSLLSRSSVLNVPTALLTTGLNEVALFSNNNTLLANRFLFVPEKKSSNNQLKLDQNEYGIREPVKINLKIIDASGVGVSGGYSISVAKIGEELDRNVSRHTIWSSLIFDTKDETGKDELDMQLITQRSNTFSWNDIFAQKQKLHGLKPERSLSIGGKVLKTDGKPLAGAKLNLFSAKNMMLIDTVANENGVFLFENFSVLDSTEVVIRVTNLGNEKNVQIILDEEVDSLTSVATDKTNTVETTMVKSKNLKQDHPNSIRPKEKVNELKTVEIVTRRRPVIPGSAYPFAAAPPDYTIEAEELHKMVSLTDYLRSRFVGVKIINNKIIGTFQGKEGPMFILLNNQNIEDLSSIDPRSLTGVQIVKGGITASSMANQYGESMYGQGTCFGIIFLTSNHHNLNFTKVVHQTTGIIRKKIPGFSAAKAFYSPNYTMKKENITKDLRDSLFWKPDIITDKEGMAELNFYTSDEKGKYQVTLEGIGINGKITREVAFFKVQ